MKRAIRKPITKSNKVTDEQINARYLEMLPLIRQIARQAFSGYDPDKREDAVQGALVWALVNVHSLAKNGRLEDAKATPIAWFAVRRHRMGRCVGVESSTTDAMSEGSRVLGRSKIKYFHIDNGVEDIFHSDSVMQDARCPITLTADLKMDYETWYHRQSPRDQEIIHDLSLGYTTNDVARKYGVSAGLISQYRKRYAKSWKSFIDPEEGMTALVPA